MLQSRHRIGWFMGIMHFQGHLKFTFTRRKSMRSGVVLTR